MTDRLRFTIELTLRSPFLFRGLEGASLGIDTPHLRDEDRRPIIPADQIRGVLREALTDLADAGAGIAKDEITALFGGKSDDSLGVPGLSNEPRRSRIEFTDLTAQGDLPPAGETTRIEIDDDTGAVKSGMLQVIELVAPFGQEVLFSGEIVLFQPAAEAERFARLFKQALALLSSIGAFKSPGFGEVVTGSSRIVFAGSRSLALPAAPKEAAAKSAEDGFRRLRIRFDRPILVDGDKIAANAVKGSAMVPGSVLKGALAQRLLRAGVNPEEGSLGRALAQLSFSHAFPESDTEREPYGLPLPLSLVVGKDGTIGDALLVPPGKGAMIGDRPALFATDWKDGVFGKAAAKLGRPIGDDPLPLARTHTAIESAAGIAEDLKLFTTIARSVRKPSGKPRGWLVDVDAGRVDEDVRPQADALIAALLDETGLDSIGKTGAHASFEPVAGAIPPDPRPILGTSDEYAIVLTTPALILDAVALTTPDGAWASTPFEAYQAYWQSVLGDAALLGFYAAQAFRGGYLARRRRLYGTSVYFPFLMTEPGSVFWIRTSNREGLAPLCRHGLTLPDMNMPGQTGVTVKPTWRTCPYVPENGYGRITADHLSTSEQFALTGVLDND